MDYGTPRRTPRSVLPPSLPPAAIIVAGAPVLHVKPISLVLCRKAASAGSERRGDRALGILRANVHFRRPGPRDESDSCGARQTRRTILLSRSVAMGGTRSRPSSIRRGIDWQAIGANESSIIRSASRYPCVDIIVRSRWTLLKCMIEPYKCLPETRMR